MIEVKDVMLKDLSHVKVSYTESKKDGSTTDYVVTSDQAPRPEFIGAVEDLAPDIMKIIGIECVGTETPDYYTNMKGVSFKHLQDGGFNAVLKAVIYVPWLESDVAINSPLMGTKPKENALGAYFGADTEKKLRTVLSEALLYIKGKRAQEVLFDEPAPATTKQVKSGGVKLIG